MFKTDRYENNIVPCHIAVSSSIQICYISLSYLSQIFKDWLLSISSLLLPASVFGNSTADLILQLLEDRIHCQCSDQQRRCGIFLTALRSNQHLK